MLTGADVAAVSKPFIAGLKQPMLHYCFAVERVRYVGEPVAAVVARSRYAAEDALERIEVEYRELDPATAPDAPLLHPDVGLEHRKRPSLPLRRPRHSLWKRGPPYRNLRPLPRNAYTPSRASSSSPSTSATAATMSCPTSMARSCTGSSRRFPGISRVAMRKLMQFVESGSQPGRPRRSSRQPYRQKRPLF